MDISITCTSVKSEPNTRHMVSVDIDGVDESDLVELLDVDVIVKHKGVEALLDEIGIDNVKNYFGLTEA